MNDSIEIADDDIDTLGLPSGAAHLYLLYDPNTDDDNDPSTGSDVQVIRGGPDLPVPPFDDILVVSGKSLAESKDAFNDDTPAERNVTTVDTNASVMWAQMTAYGNAIMSGGFDYDLLSGNSNIFLTFMANSNSVAASVLSSVGIDISKDLPIEGGDANAIGGNRLDAETFPGDTTILVAPGNWTLQGFESDNLFIEKGAGQHILYGGDTGNAVLYSIADGLDAVRYDQTQSGTIFQYILTTTTEPPKDFLKDPWIRFILHGAPAQERLLQCDL